MSPVPELPKKQTQKQAPKQAQRQAEQKAATGAPVLQRSKKDWIATGVIAAVSVIAVGGAMLTANINNVTMTQEAAPGTDTPVTVMGEAPDRLAEAFTLPTTGFNGQTKPLTSRGLIITNDEHTVTATTPEGATAWTYGRSDYPICSIGTAWDKVVVTYETGVGCGDVISIDAATGKYADTRSSLASTDVVPISSNDRVGTVSTERVEVWRSDMVRTVEYGEVEAKQEGDFQPHEDCVINSAMTRTELVVVSETCPDEPETSYLRFMNATPEDSRKPEITKDVAISAEGARLVAVGQEAAAVYVPSTPPLIISFDKEGQETSRTEVAASPAVAEASAPYAPPTADLPHHMSWFDGQRIYLFNPGNLAVERIIDGVKGIGVAVGEEYLVPNKEGIAVINTSTGEVTRTIAVDRGGYTGPVSLNMAGTSIVELRGDTVAALTTG